MTDGPHPVRTVRHGAGAYPVYLGPGLLAGLDGIVQQHHPDHNPYHVTDAVVATLLHEWRSDPRHAWRAPGADPSAPGEGRTITIPEGENSKSRGEWARVTDLLLEGGAGRDTVLVAIGGGVVGDLAGFVAATYMRGIPYVTVPTTLLAMVDASVGGKTGLDTPHGKNLVGAFHPPSAVVADLCCLRTLSADAFRAGLAESIKHAVMADHDLFVRMTDRADDIQARDLDVLGALVESNLAIKADVVEADERESGRRAHLNLGHTVAHAIERTTDYQVSHGDAVSLGLIAECALAAALDLAPDTLADEVSGLLGAFGLPTSIPGGPTASEVISAMRFDKKNREARPRFALPAAIGAMADRQAPFTRAVAEDDRMRGALRRIALV